MRAILVFLIVGTLALIVLGLLSSPSHGQTVVIPQRVGTIQQRINYPTPLRNLFFGKVLSTPIYRQVPYRMVTPPPRPVYVQPPSYLVPMGQPYPTSTPPVNDGTTTQYRVIFR